MNGQFFWQVSSANAWVPTHIQQQGERVAQGEKTGKVLYSEANNIELVSETWQRSMRQ